MVSLYIEWKLYTILDVLFAFGQQRQPTLPSCFLLTDYVHVHIMNGNQFKRKTSAQIDDLLKKGNFEMN